MFKVFTIASLYFLGTCLAQTSSSPEDCSPSDFTGKVDKRAIFFNASGTLSIEFKGAKDPWYISTAVTDERDETRTFDGTHSRQWIKGFISVPRYLVADKSVGVCSFMFQGLNSSSENPDDAGKSCKGVISDACIKEFENSTLPIRASGNCPSSSAFILSDECKKHLTSYQLVQARNISTENCTLSNIPNLDVPVDYWTFGGSVSTGETGSDDYDDFDSYDMRIQQTIPIFTVVSGGGISDRKLVCITPDKVVSGSRKPEIKLEGTEEDEDEDEEGESEEGDENMGSRVGGWGAVFLSTVVMIFTLLLTTDSSLLLPKFHMMFRVFAVVALHLAVTCMAQNSSLSEDCPAEIQHIDEGNLIYNSTRTARTRFRGQSLPWYITAAITDRRAPNLTFRGVDTSQELSVFISVPKTLPETGSPAGSDVRLCSSMLKALNRTSENPPDMDAPDDTPAAARCSVDKMPYIDLPTDYMTFGTGLWTGLIGDEDRKDFDMYDLRVQQTIPLLFSAAGMSRLICIAPDQVVPGSRKPQLKLEEDEPEEDENTAPRAGGLGAAIFLGVGAMIFSLL
ncbi:hypothetical protein FVER53263_12671 [Fusarium verticillioides]|nr:hypothetical protein FVER53263_12671 [Fusarium verticillioides]